MKKLSEHVQTAFKRIRLAIGWACRLFIIMAYPLRLHPISSFHQLTKFHRLHKSHRHRDYLLDHLHRCFLRLHLVGI